MWKKRIFDIEQQINLNPLMESYIFEHFALECAYGVVRHRLSETNRPPWPPRSQSEYRLYSFAAAYSRVHQRLSSAGKRRLSGMLRGALKEKYGIAPLAQEFEIAIYLMGKGFDVEFHDIESGGGFDYLAVKDDIRIEVECKFISEDIGRKIHRRQTYQLGCVLYPILSRMPDIRADGILLRITLPDRLYSRPEQHEAIASAVKKAMTSQSQIYRDDTCHVRAEPFPLSEFNSTLGQTGKPTDAHVRQFLEIKFGIENKATMALYRPSQSLFLVVLESEKSDQVVQSIVRQLKESAERQFSGKNPACLTAHMVDLTQGELLKLADAEKERTDFHKAVDHLLKRRPQLHSIAFCRQAML